MAIFGFPLDQPDHALKAVMAAHEILVRLERQYPEWEAKGLPVFKTRIGISTGEVVIGNVGGSKRRAFTAMGDAANIASRLEALNKRFGTHVLLDESTARMLPAGIPLKELGEVQVRGISLPIRIYNPAFDKAELSSKEAREADRRQ
jgi:class 3 adenylate cyclase